MCQLLLVFSSFLEIFRFLKACYYLNSSPGNLLPGVVEEVVADEVPLMSKALLAFTHAAMVITMFIFSKVVLDVAATAGVGDVAPVVKWLSKYQKTVVALHFG